MKRHHQFLLIFGPLAVAAVLVAAFVLPSKEKPRAPAGQPLKVITFNVQLLPGIGALGNKRSHASYRAAAIADKLAGYDLIGLNEVFHLTHRETLLSRFRQLLGKDFHVVTSPPEARSFFGIDSGLVLISRLPILASHTLAYGNDSSIWKHGIMADGFAAKGALHARVGRRDGATDDFLDVFVTHLESEESATREAQYPKLAEFIRTHSDPHHPALMLGDFNTVGNPAEVGDPGSQYGRMLAALKRGRPGAGLLDLWPQMSAGGGGTSDPDTPDGGDRIDYIFVSNPSGDRPELRPVDVRVNPFHDPKVKALSDHCAVEADFEWERP